MFWGRRNQGIRLPLGTVETGHRDGVKLMDVFDLYPGNRGREKDYGYEGLGRQNDRSRVVHSFSIGDDLCSCSPSAGFSGDAGQSSGPGRASKVPADRAITRSRTRWSLMA